MYVLKNTSFFIVIHIIEVEEKYNRTTGNFYVCVFVSVFKCISVSFLVFFQYFSYCFFFVRKMCLGEGVINCISVIIFLNQLKIQNYLFIRNKSKEEALVHLQNNLEQVIILLSLPRKCNCLCGCVCFYVHVFVWCAFVFCAVWCV